MSFHTPSLISGALVGALILFAAHSANAQCDPTACAPMVNATADVLCTTAREAENSISDYRDAAAQAQAREQQCLGRLAEVRATPAKARSPWWLRRGLEVAIAGGGVALGASLGSGSTELIVGVAVFEVALLVGRGVLGWLDDRR